MGIANVTPDSFSDGGQLEDWERVDAQVDALWAAGAHVIDIGAESTRPGATPLTAEQEWARLEPMLGALCDKYRQATLRPLLSVDTYHVDTARRALALGADIINDVSGLTSAAMIELAGASGKDWIAMHNVGVPADPAKTLPFDQDPGEAVERWLGAQLREWEHAGLDVERIIFDPGIGFGKNPLQSLRLLRDIGDSTLRLALPRRALAQVVHAQVCGRRQFRPRSFHDRRIAGLCVLKASTFCACTTCRRT